MHEYSIVRSLIERVEQEAESRGATAVHRIRVRIGELAGVEPSLLESAYEIFRDRTICRDARLEVQSEDAAWVCPDCERPIARGAILRCGRCDTPAKLIRGDAIMLEQIEMEVRDV
jgi:hydrogenase nickel incorporation protein HypA/HybF